MSLSAIMFYTDKTYPSAIITNKSTLPESTEELVKDKVYMSVVFTVKYTCDYKKFITPETRLKEDVHVTPAQLEKIISTLEKKHDITFKKKEFATVGDMAIYVKDLKNK